MSYNYSQQPYGYRPQEAVNGHGTNGFQNGPMPGFNFSAPVIHMSAPGRPGQSGDRRGGRPDHFDSGSHGRAGLGADPRELERTRQQTRESMIAAQPPTREEIARTIFVGGLGEDTPPDHVLEHILKSVGKLRRWARARDAQDSKCRFGFAEFEDVDSLEAAKAAFDGGFDVPAYKDKKIVRDEDESRTIKMVRILVVIDEQSSKYIDDWMSKRNQSDEAKQFRIDGAKEDLRQCLAELMSADEHAGDIVLGGDTLMADAPAGETVEIQLGGPEDDLGDIPAEVRAQVAEEIQSFRDRARRLDAERLKKETDIRAADLVASHRTHNRLASPGPTSGANGVPSGPRITGVPSGPKGYRGVQLPSDYVGGVAFVNGSGAPQEEDDSDASDFELEKRREAIKEREQEKLFADAERVWLNREKQRLAALERERKRDVAEEEDLQRQREQMARRLENWNDEEEDRLGREDFYVDRSRWALKRAKRRDAELREDERDRQAEEEELNAGRRHASEIRSAADQFLEQTSAELAASRQSGPADNAFKFSLGGTGTKRENTAAVPKRTLAEVAGFLDDEANASAAGQQRGPRAIAQAEFDDAAADVSDSDQAAKRQRLAAEIPSDTASLFAWDVRWSYIDDNLLEREIRPFVNKKVLEYLGVQEDFLVDLVISGLKEQKDARQLVADLEPALEDEAEVLVKKVWRLVVFWAEAESRGLN